MEIITTESFNGDYVSMACPNCGRHRVMICQDGKHHCEKCNWCVEDREYQTEFYNK